MCSMGCECFPIEGFADEVSLIGNQEANYIWCCVGGFNESSAFTNWEHSREKREQQEKGKGHYRKYTYTPMGFFLIMTLFFQFCLYTGPQWT